MAACPVCCSSVAEEQDGTPGVIWSSPLSKPVGHPVTSESVLVM